MNSIRFSSQANLDFELLTDYIHVESSQSARRWVEKLIVLLQTISENPLMGKRQLQLGEHFRSFPYHDYLIFYETDDNGITILRIINGAREITEDCFSELDK